MTEDDKWIKKCLDDPERYKIYVDNDDIFVVEVTEAEDDYYGDSIVYSFSCFGYDFVVVLLEYLGANVDYV